MKTIQLKGYVEDRRASSGRRKVAGHAFEIEGFEFMHLWVTPFLGYGYEDGKLTVTQWESGLRLLVYADSIEEAIAQAKKIVEGKGAEVCRKAVAAWQSAPIR